MRNPLIIKTVLFFLVVFSGVFINCSDSGGGEDANENANLSDLTISNGDLSPAFSKDITAYTVEVENDVTSTTVTPTAEGNAIITINAVLVESGMPSGPIALAVGENIITITVIAEDGVTTKDYTIIVTRLEEASNNANLSNLAVSDGILSPVFDEDITAYTVEVEGDVTSTTVTPTAEDGNATITVNAVLVASGTPSGTIALAVGENVITITVTAEDGVTTKDYTITVTRLEEAISTWSKTYGYGETYCEYHTYGFDSTDDGGYVFTAEGIHNGAGSYDYWVVKLDSGGNIDWEYIFGGSSIEGVKSVIQTSDNGYLAAGDSYTFRTGDRYCDIWLIKLNNLGGIVWQKNYGGTGTDVPKEVQETFNNQGDSTGYLLIGYTTSFGEGGYDIWVLKLNTSGGIEWQKTYGGGDDEFGRSIQQVFDQDGDPDGYLMTADTQSFGAGGRDVWLVRLDNSGIVEWEKTYGGGSSEIPYSVQVANDGGYVVGADTSSFGAGGSDFWAFKVDASGDLLWQYTYGGVENDSARDLQKTADGGYVMTGWTYSFDSIMNDAWVVKLNSTGGIDWQKIYNKPIDGYPDFGSDWAYAVVQTSDGGYAISGDTDWESSERNCDVWIFKLDSNGALGCGIETDTDAVPDDSAIVTVNDTNPYSTSNTSANVGDTACSVNSLVPDTFTQCDQQ
ncbi:MAG: cadherin-like beta sandwich domain-containing protein [Spirochaetota bacterium]|nr:cadherin-like beta sandwich domain-containing protein [Spirochaetota bacterium]